MITVYTGTPAWQVSPFGQEGGPQGRRRFSWARYPDLLQGGEFCLRLPERPEIDTIRQRGSPRPPAADTTRYGSHFGLSVRHTD